MNGIEPPTQGSSGPCSTNWATWPWRSWRDSNPRSPLWQRGMLTTTPQDHGCGGVTRTHDLLVMSQASYHCSTPRFFLADMEGFEPPRELPHLSVFKTDPFSHLGTCPFFWWSTWELNPEPRPYKERALTDWASEPMVAKVGIEPTTSRVWTECSSQMSYLA